MTVSVGSDTALVELLSEDTDFGSEQTDLLPWVKRWDPVRNRFLDSFVDDSDSRLSWLGDWVKRTHLFQALVDLFNAD